MILAFFALYPDPLLCVSQDRFTCSEESSWFRYSEVFFNFFNSYLQIVLPGYCDMGKAEGIQGLSEHSGGSGGWERSESERVGGGAGEAEEFFSGERPGGIAGCRGFCARGVWVRCRGGRPVRAAISSTLWNRGSARSRIIPRPAPMKQSANRAIAGIIELLYRRIDFRQGESLDTVLKGRRSDWECRYMKVEKRLIGLSRRDVATGAR
jgi:hypothetical protein